MPIAEQAAECASCGRETDSPWEAFFHFGKDESTMHHFGLFRVVHKKHRLRDEQRGLVCKTCMTRYQSHRALSGLVLLGTAVLLFLGIRILPTGGEGLIRLVAILGFVASVVCFFLGIPRLIFFFAAPQDVADAVLIQKYGAPLKQEGMNIFLTTRQFNRLDRRSR